MADIVLIYPYQYQQARDAKLFHPLGIAQLSALLRREGLDTTVMDLTFSPLDTVMEELLNDPPRVVGIYIMLTMQETALKLARCIHELVPQAVLVCGGPLPTLKPKQFAVAFDLVFRGEAIHSLPRFCRDYLEADALTKVIRQYARYPGLYFHDPEIGDVLEAPPQVSTEDTLDQLPPPDRSDYQHALYQHFWQEREGFAPAGIMTTYGCPYQCDFCSKPIFGTDFRRRNVERVMDEILDIRSLGYDGLWIADDCFTLDMGHVRGLCHRLIQEKLHMRWTCLSRTDQLLLEDVMLMRDAGCKKVFLGLETGSNEVLKLMNKHTTVEAAEHTLNLFSQCGIETAGFFMIGYPGETYRTIETTLSWALTLPLEEISFTIPVPLPDTSLYQKVHGLRMEADWRYENENRILYQSEFDEGYLLQRIEQTYAEFADRHGQKLQKTPMQGV